MHHADYLAHDATALAARVAAGDVSPAALLDLALAQHARAHGRVNAVVRLMEREARARVAGPLTGPLAGVPFLIKDGVQDYAGIPTTYGSRSMTNNVPARHAHVVQRYLDAGLVIFGKTNLPEFATRGVTDPVLYGRTNNPWDLARTPGGSSGGAAAAVAAGIVPMAAGNDGGGSLRIPAACCGLFTLRPSRGRVSSGPGIGEVWFGASSESVISRSVRDAALALDVLQGAEPGDPFVVAPPAAPYVELMRRDPGRLRIGYSTVSPIGTEVHPEAVRAVARTAELLARLGHEVEEAAPSIDGAALAKVICTCTSGRFRRPYDARRRWGRGAMRWN
ncbi:amidase [Massilia sp.]|uniref:amidase n=1 Tax=Massilia sp. TaxID=1882437 RepID=UPI00352C6D1B